MNILVFTHLITGHFLEYIHHIYEGAAKDIENQYFFIIPRVFEDVKSNYSWIDAPNLNFIYLSDEELTATKKKNQIIVAWYLSRIVKKYVRDLSVDRVFLLWLIGLMPFLPLFLPRTVKVSGILYRIHLYKKDDQSGLKNFIEDVRMRFICLMHNVEEIYVLNDKKSTTTLNSLYGVNKFRYLPDPVPHIVKTDLKNLREDLNIEGKKKIYLHFGAMDERKGTLTILKAIIETKPSILNNSAFIFAGRVDKTIKKDFYEILKTAERKCEIIVYDKFCENEFLYNLCYTCDYILIPYFNTCQSSGVIGYASFFRKPVIGPSNGLLGHLIKENRLGLTIDDIDSRKLAEQLERDIIFNCEDSYSKSHTVEAFIDAVFCKIGNSRKYAV